MSKHKVKHAKEGLLIRLEEVPALFGCEWPSTLFCDFFFQNLSQTVSYCPHCIIKHRVCKSIELRLVQRYKLIHLWLAYPLQRNNTCCLGVIKSAPHVHVKGMSWHTLLTHFTWRRGINKILRKLVKPDSTPCYLCQSLWWNDQKGPLTKIC